MWEIQRELNWCKPKHKTIQTDHNLFTQGSETDIPFESALCTYFYAYLHDYMYSNMSWHANVKKSFVMMILVAENKSKNIHVFTLWLFFFLPSSLSLSLFMWLRACSLIGKVVWDPVLWLLAWKAGTTMQEASSYLERMGRRTQQTSQELCRISHKVYSNQAGLR